MSLSIRLTLLLAGVLTLGALVGDRLQRGFVERQLESIELGTAEHAAHQVQRALVSKAEEVGRDALRLSCSDRLHAAMAQPAAGLDQRLLAPRDVAEAGLDVVAVLDLNGRARYLHVQHPDHPEVTALQGLGTDSADTMRLFGQSASDSESSEQSGCLAAGLIATEAGPLLVAARNLLPTTQQGPREGIVVAGRFVGSTLDRDLEQLLGFGVDVWSLAARGIPSDAAKWRSAAAEATRPVLIPVSDQRLDVYTTLVDVRDRPEILVRTTLKREVAEAAAIGARSGLLLSICLSAGLLLALTAALRTMVWRPIQRLQSSLAKVGEQEDYSLRVDAGRADAIGAVAHTIDKLLERLEEAQRKVSETARAAGMSEIAMGILHNVGNVLNSVNISTSVLSERVTGMCIEDLAQLAHVLEKHSDDLAEFLTQDPQGKQLQPFLSALVEQLTNDRAEIAHEVEALSSGIEHVCELVKSQQGLARKTQVAERVTVESLVEDAVRMTERSRGQGTFAVSVELEPGLPALVIDRHKALEIVVNLVQNARQAIESAPPRVEGHKLLVRAFRTFGGKLRVEVRDTGVGIAQENLTRIFHLGFTTKARGSGLGLHSAANGARSLGGVLSVASAGKGHGAVFTLEVPFDVKSEKEAA